MAGTSTDVHINLKDGGSIKAKTEEAKELNKELKTAQKLATGTQTGAKALKQTGGYKAARASAADEITEYGRARATEKRTGASARDFANEAQGLGGLVRLYATYAANLYAVSMAFNALREAMNTDNMIKGLDQLGAASGVAMGSLAKDFAAASGGAISLRESMEATAKAISSGMSSRQFLQLGEVAKKASQALGVNMSDAVSRLTRGITKLEPELLDELGLFTRVDQAVKDYAKSVGRSEASLNSFERRQAFANAVLAEGAQKFGEINIDTNPYDLLLAKLKDTSQQILSVINKIIGPIAKVLSENTELIAASIGLLAMKLFSQVMPVIGHYRDTLKASAKEAKDVAEAKAAAAESSANRIKAAKAAEIRAIKEAAAASKDARVEEAQNNLNAISKGKLSKKTREILDPTKSILEVSQKDIEYLDKLSQKNTALAGTYGQLVRAIKEAKQANLDYIETEKKLTEYQSKAPGRFSQAGKNARDAEKARQAYASKSIVSNAAELAAIEGSGAAWKSMNEAIKEEKLSSFRAGMTRAATAAALLGNSISVLASGLSTAFFYVGVFVAAFQLLDGVFSKNSKEMEKFTSSVDSLSQGLDAAELTAKKYDNVLTPASLQAKATALQNVADSFTAVSEAAEAAAQNASFWDRGIDNIKDLFGYGMSDKLGQQAKKSVETARKLLTDPKAKQAFDLKVKALVGDKDIQEYFDDLDLAKGVTEFKKLQGAISGVNTENQRTAGNLADAVSSLGGLKDAVKDVEKAAKGAEDPISKLGIKLTDSSTAFMKALEDPTNALAGLTALMKDTEAMKVFGAGMFNNLTSATAELKAYQAELEKVNRFITEGQNLQKTASPELKARGAAMEIGGNARKAELEGLIKGIFSNLDAGFQENMKKGLKLIEQPLANAVAMASNKLASTLAGLLPNNKEAVMAQAAVEKQGIDIQIKNTTALYELNKTLQISNLLARQAQIEMEASKAAEMASKGDPALYKQLMAANKNPELERIKKDIQVIQSGNFKGIAKGDWTADTTQAYSRSVTSQASIAGMVGQKAAIDISAKMKYQTSAAEEEMKKREDALARERKAREDYYKMDEFAAKSAAEQNRIRSQDSISFMEKEASISEAKINNEKNYLTLLERTIAAADIDKNIKAKILASTAARLTYLNEELPKLQEQNKLTAEAAKQEAARSDTLQKTLERLDKQEQALELARINQNIKETEVSTQQQLADLDLQILQYKYEQGAVSADQVREAAKAADIAKVIADRQVKVNSILLQQDKLRLDYARKIAETNDPAKRAALQTEKDAKIGELDAQINAVKSLADAQIGVINITQSMTERQREYGNFFKSSMDKMGDALAEFATTGKLDFNSLIESMISDLVRLEMRFAMMQIWEGIRGGQGGFLSTFVNGILGSLGGGGFGGYKGTGIDPTTLTGADITKAFMAKGGAWESGVQAFAKGGTFTNSIVSSPTTFKFAKGTGLMGEAGPEAIMPLRRGPDGSLGVQAQQAAAPKTEVVVHNYGDQKATTKETQDNRGNRKIEVIIGEMVSGELGRTNSPMQAGMKANFGINPMLNRR